MQKIIFLISFFFIFFGCNSLKESKGLYNEIIIISSIEDKYLLNDSIDSLFADFIITPSKEFLYDVKWINPNYFRDYLEYKNLLFISISSPKDSTIDNLVNQFVSNYKQNIFTLSDVYANNQLLMIVKSDNSITFLRDIEKNKDWIIENIENNISNIINNYLYKQGRDVEIEQHLKAYYGISSKIQNDYMIIKNDSINKNFTWIGRGYPYRWLTFMKFNYAKTSSVWDEYKKFVSKNMVNVKISDYYKNILFESDDIVKIQGLYEEEYSNSGGPFIAYAKFDGLKDEIFIVSGFVNNPGKSKNKLLKELEVQIKNIIYEEKYET